MKKIFNILCCLLATLAVVGCSLDEMESPTGAIHGFACAEDGTPLTGCTVEIAGTNQVTKVNEEGRFYFFHVPAGGVELLYTQEDGTQTSDYVAVPSDNVLCTTFVKYHSDFPFVLEPESGSSYIHSGENIAYATARIKNTSKTTQTCRVYGEGNLTVYKVLAPGVYKELGANDEFTLEQDQYASIFYKQPIESLTEFSKIFVAWKDKKQVTIWYNVWE